MNNYQIDLIRRALELLHRLVPDDEPRAGGPSKRPCCVTTFAKRYLAQRLGSDMTSAQLFQFYQEVAASGEVEQLSKADFLRRLPDVLEALFGAKKSHCVLRDGHRLRGFKNIDIRDCNLPVSVLEFEPEPE